MRRRDTYKHDAFDNYASRLLKNWAFTYPSPVNGRALLFVHIAQSTKDPFLWLNVALAILRWSFRNLILEPIDIALQPVLYFSDLDMYPSYINHKGINQHFLCQ
jgi:hypothetical protein